MAAARVFAKRRAALTRKQQKAMISRLGPNYSAEVVRFVDRDRALITALWEDLKEASEETE